MRKLLLQKQITVNNESDYILHSVVVGSQLNALFLEEREFAVGQAAADGITSDVFQETESHLIDSVFGQVSLEAIQVLDFRAIG